MIFDYTLLEDKLSDEELRNVIQYLKDYRQGIDEMMKSGSPQKIKIPLRDIEVPGPDNHIEEIHYDFILTTVDDGIYRVEKAY